MSKKIKPSLPLLIKNISLVDTHCHLDMLGSEAERQDAIDRATAAGVKYIITIGIDMESSRQAVLYASHNENVYATVGIHPHHAAELASKKVLKELQHLAGEKKVVGYGEIGIDTVKNYAPLDIQQKAFIEQLTLAKELQLPIIIHDREAHEEILSLLQSHGPFPSGGVIHCFSGDAHLAEKFIELGFYISIPGVVTFKKAEMLHDAVKAIPLDRLLIETDAPFLAPVPYRGKKNEPVYTLYTAEKIAELKKIDINEIARITTENAMRLFSLTV